MNIHQIAVKTNISLKNLRKLEKLKINFAKLDPEIDDEHPEAAKMRYLLMRKSQLPVPLLMILLDNSDVFFDLRKYAERAREQIAALGDVRSQAAPVEIRAAIDEAPSDPNAAQALANWLLDILPAQGYVTHHWVAARLLIGMTPFEREQSAPRISLALMHMRKIEDFRPYWNSVENSQGRKSIKYSQPLDI